MDDLILDLQELQSLYHVSSRSTVKDSLLTLIKNLEKRISDEKAQNSSAITSQSNGDSIAKNKQHMVNYKITTYAYDQSDKFFKIIISKDMVNIQNHPDDKIIASFTENSCKLLINEFNNANYELVINHLCGTIIPKDSFIKKKNDNVTVMLRKKSSNTWSHVSKKNEKPENKTPKIDKDKDPNESLMDMMKQMYEDGDDEMKRTIAKAWSESKNKNTMY